MHVNVTHGSSDGHWSPAWWRKMTQLAGTDSLWLSWSYSSRSAVDETSGFSVNGTAAIVRLSFVEDVKLQIFLTWFRTFLASTLNLQLKNGFTLHNDQKANWNILKKVTLPSRMTQTDLVHRSGLHVSSSECSPSAVTQATWWQDPQHSAVEFDSVYCQPCDEWFEINLFRTNLIVTSYFGAGCHAALNLQLLDDGFRCLLTFVWFARVAVRWRPFFAHLVID